LNKDNFCNFPYLELLLKKHGDKCKIRSGKIIKTGKCSVMAQSESTREPKWNDTRGMYIVIISYHYMEHVPKKNRVLK
jgi:hypothetical protein